MAKPLKAKKIVQYLIEPKTDGCSPIWESHHATNPCVVRFHRDPRVFLGYRAGGTEDYFRFGQHDAWASHLGLAVLDEEGKKVRHRLPLPIMTRHQDVPLPRNDAEYEQCVKLYNDRVRILHDFRFFEYQDYLYVIFHESSLTEVFDCIVRMPVDAFIQKVDQSISLSAESVENIQDRWGRIWWQEDMWEPCGVEGTNRIFASPVIKGDIVFFELADGSLQLSHRPMGDGIAVLNVGSDLFARATPDSMTLYGHMEHSQRPGYLDNSHVGNNGLPTRAKIGSVDVYVDVTHGCHNRMISDHDCNTFQIRYYPYFRIKDFRTGDLLYYSEVPILDFDKVWKEYVEDGTWIRQNKLLRGVMFAGGQIEVSPRKNGLDDEFITYVGLGDTAIGAATFTLRDVIPDQVLEDILSRKTHEGTLDGVKENTFVFPKLIQGWNWSVFNDPHRRCLRIGRQLTKGEYAESGARTVLPSPGRFDSDGLVFDGHSIRYAEGIGWIVLYKGLRWEQRGGQKTTQVGYGFLILDNTVPEKILYRSTEPIQGMVTVEPGWTAGSAGVPTENFLDKAEERIPPRVLYEIRRTIELFQNGKLFGSQMMTWLGQKSGLIDRSQQMSLRLAND
jgi:hypothetical protein